MTSTIYPSMMISGRDFPASFMRSSSSSSFSNIASQAAAAAAAKPPRVLLLRIRNSGGDVSAVETEESDQSQIEVPKGPPSLISALNVEKALRGIPITDADHYRTLGLQKGSSYYQVTIAYKNKVEELMNEGLDEKELTQKLDLLKESHSILSSVEERRLYDWSFSRSERPNRYEWPFEVDITQIPTQSPPPPEPEDVGPTRLVGYFMLAWLLLGFALSIALNR